MFGRSTVSNQKEVLKCAICCLPPRLLPSLFATPAVAQDNSGYIGIEGGVMFPRTPHIYGSVNFTDPLVADINSSKKRLGQIQERL